MTEVDINELLASLTTAESERDAMADEAFQRRREQDRQAKTIEVLEARLAAVEVLCDEVLAPAVARRVRAAARGEGDRG